MIASIQNLPLNELDCNSQVVIFGTGHLGIVCLNALRAYGIEPTAFCDSNMEMYGETIFGVIVKNPRQAVEEHSDTIFLLAAFQRKVREEMHEILSDAAPAIGDRASINVYSSQSLIFWYYTDYIKRPVDLSKFQKTVQRSFTEENNVFNVVTTMVHITQHCTLRCKHCSNFMPYLPIRRHEDANEIIETVRSFCEFIDSVGTLTLVGGEGLLHPDIVKIMESIAKCDKVMIITIVTNGTWLPGDEIFDAMSKLGVTLRISDYGKVSDKIEDLAENCKKFSVVCFREYRSSTWVEHGTQYNRQGFHRTCEENKRLYKECIYFQREKTRVCNSMLLRGRWYICDRYVVLTKLGVIDENALEDADFVPVILQDREQDNRRKRFIEVLNRDYLPVCDFCKFPQTLVPAGEQLE